MNKLLRECNKSENPNINNLKHFANIRNFYISHFFGTNYVNVIPQTELIPKHSINIWCMDQFTDSDDDQDCLYLCLSYRKTHMQLNSGAIVNIILGRSKHEELLLLSQT